MSTFNGIGTKFYGSTEHGPDGLGIWHTRNNHPLVK